MGSCILPGYIYTRIVQKGAEALGILKEYEYELEVLEVLLSQRRWRRGSRGAWHDRRALIFMTHLKGKDEAIQRALDAVMEGLKDDDTHTSLFLIPIILFP
jgi:Fanconi-associated nuclease 1